MKAPISTVDEVLDDDMRDEKPPVHIAIIGGGPKGIYGFERLVAQCKKLRPDRQIVVHIFNRTPQFAAGEIYDPGQPEFLKMNVCRWDINMWLPDEIPPAVCKPLSFDQWEQASEQKGSKIKETFPARRFVGRYLIEGYERMKNEMPSSMSLSEEVGEVIAINRQNEGYKLTIKSKLGLEKTLHNTFSYLLLATGHPTPASPLSPNGQSSKTAPHTKLIPFIYPIHPNMDMIASGTVVGIKGMGLTFVDAILALSEGRGGRFSRNKDNKLTYEKSGQEPRLILPFSRHGLPMIPRTGKKKKTKLKYFTPQRISKILLENRKVDFESELWPLIVQDYYHTYYLNLFAKYGYKIAMMSSQSCSFEPFEQEIENFHEQFHKVKPFDLKQFFHPLAGVKFHSAKELHSFIMDYLKEGLDENKQLDNDHFWYALTEVWCAAAPLFGKVYAHGGLTPESQEIFANQYAPMLHRVSYGPPSTSMEKILTLAEEGMINFATSSQAELAKEEFIHLVSQIDGLSTQLDALVDARIPKTDIRASTDGLYHQLIKKGEISLYQNEDNTTGNCHEPGCLALDENGFVLDAYGNVNTSIAATGTPTEGVTYDNDALSPTRNNFVSKWSAFVINEIKNSEAHAPHHY